MSDSTTDWSVLKGTLDCLTTEDRLRLIEEVARSLRTPPTATSPEQRRATLDRLRHDLSALPVANPSDGFSNRDHDDELYGGSS